METILCYQKNRPIEECEFPEIYELLRQSFPEEEIRTMEGQKNLFGKDCYKMYLKREKDNSLAALIAAWEFEHLRFIEHITVHPDKRNSGLGGRLLDWYVKKDDKLAVLEVELPDLDLAKRRIRFYERHGFYVNEFPYTQFPLREGKNKLPLYLMSFGKAFAENDFMRIRDFLYQHVYGIV